MIGAGQLPDCGQHGRPVVLRGLRVQQLPRHSAQPQVTPDLDVDIIDMVVGSVVWVCTTVEYIAYWEVLFFS